MEALSFRLKFATGIHQNITTNTILRNYRNCDTDFSKGFIQRIILTSISQSKDSSHPKKYIQALSNLTQNPNIVISSADKSGAIVIMHKHMYIDKINSFLDDTNIYEIFNLITINKDITSFTKLFKKTQQKQKLGFPSLNTTLQSPHYMAYPKSKNQTSLYNLLFLTSVEPHIKYLVP